MNKWLASFDSTDFAFSADVRFNRGLKWSLFANILLSLSLSFEFKVAAPLNVGGRHHSLFDKR